MTEFPMSDLRPSEQKWVALLVLEAVKDLVKVDDREILRRFSKARVVVLPSANREGIPAHDDNGQRVGAGRSCHGTRVSGGRL